MDLKIAAVVLLALIAAGGALLAIRIVIQRRSDHSTKSNLRNVRTRGDVAGRDINKKP